MKSDATKRYPFVRIVGAMNSMAAMLAFVLMLISLSHAQVVTDVLSFAGSSESPGLVTPAQGRDGKLYGTTSGLPDRTGLIFRVGTDGTGNVLHVFNGTDGSGPDGGVMLATDGNYYGTASYGGTNGLGVLF